MKKKMKITTEDYIRMNRKISREEEIARHGHPIGFRRVFKSRKVYDRKRSKADLNKDLPYFFESVLCMFLPVFLPDDIGGKGIKA